MNMLSIPGAPGWFETLLNMSLQATLLAGVVWVVLRLFGRWIPPSWRALLWFVVIARVLIPFAPPSPLSLQNLFMKEPPVAARGVVKELSAEQSQFDVDSFPAPKITEPEATPFVQELPAKTVRRSLNWAQIASGIWAVTGALLIGLLLVRSLVIWYRLIRYGSRPTPFILGLISDCRSQLRLRYPVRATVSDRIAAPALTGLMPARLIIPSGFGEARFNVRQLRHILLHELAHVQQGHLFLHWLALIARALHWFNPAIHFAAVRLRQECELAADAAALQNSTAEDRAAYGETILQIIAESAAPPTLLALGMAEQARHLQHRLRALTRNQRCFSSLGIVCAIVLAVTGLTGASIARTDSTTSVAAVGAPTNKIPVLGDIPVLGRLFRSDTTSTNVETAQLSSPDRSGSERKDTENSQSPKETTNSAPVNAARKRLLEKLETIRIDDFPLPSEVDLVEVLKEIGSEVRKRDASGRGVNLIISQSADRDPNAAAPIDVERFRIKFDPPLRDVTLGQFFDALVQVALPPEGAPATTRLKYSVEDYAIVFSQDAGATNKTGTPSRAPHLNSAADESAGLASSSAARQKIIQKLDTIRIDDFPLTTPVDLIEVLKELRMETRKLDPEHEGVNFVIDKSQRLKANADIDVERFKIKIDPPVRNVTVGQLCDVIVRVGVPPDGAPNDAALAFTITDYGVVFSLRKDAELVKPEPTVREGRGAPNGKSGANAKPDKSTANDSLETEKSGNQPAEQAFVSRTFRVNPNLFKQGLERVLFSNNPFRGNIVGQPDGAVTRPENPGITYVTTVTNMNTVRQQARAFFIAAGVDFPTNNVAVGGAVPDNFGRHEPGQPTQKAFFLNDRTGVLYVRATVDELNIIENALHTLNAGSTPNKAAPANK